MRSMQSIELQGWTIACPTAWDQYIQSTETDTECFLNNAYMTPMAYIVSKNNAEWEINLFYGAVMNIAHESRVIIIRNPDEEDDEEVE